MQCEVEEDSVCVGFELERRRCGVHQAAIRRPGKNTECNRDCVRTKSENGVLYDSETRAEWYIYSTQRAVAKKKKNRDGQKRSATESRRREERRGY